ncbi:hypothetical protein acdb102_19520 [Acidothermaceae bacterium B102]|nr:hypothetical protein acdb102_19520 [Acidothermaceae bacterium B102]
MVLERLGQGVPGGGVVVPNGVEFTRFASNPVAWSDRSGVVYVGALDHRFDWDLVNFLAEKHPQEVFSLYGPRPSIARAVGRNIKLMGPVNYASLPDILRHHRVGILPLNSDPSNLGRSPMKLHEYLASGLRVVSSGTPAIAAHGYPDVHCYSSEAEANIALNAALAVPPTVAGVAATRAMDWSERAKLVLAACARMPRADGFDGTA